MARVRMTPLERIVDYFLTEDLTEVAAALATVVAIVKSRQRELAAPDPPKKRVRPSRAKQPQLPKE